MNEKTMPQTEYYPTTHGPCRSLIETQMVSMEIPGYEFVFSQEEFQGAMVFIRDAPSNGYSGNNPLNFTYGIIAEM
jgi:hypothetical protein